jgi:phage regulator Rha-like protein
MDRKTLEDVQPIELVIEHDRPMVSSLQITVNFGKLHKDVLRSIEKAKDETSEAFVSAISRSRP